MSTIKVNKIENTSTTDGGISIDNSGHVTVDGQQLPSAGALSSRNLLINGDFKINQRGGTQSTINEYSLDRWRSYGGPMGFTISQQDVLSTLSTSKYALRLQRTSGNTQTNNIGVVQGIESNNCEGLAGTKLTLSFKARVGGDFSQASDQLQSSVFYGQGTDENPVGMTSQTSTLQNNDVTTSFTTFTQTVTVPANTTQISVAFSYTPAGTAGTNDYFDIAEVQIERGDVATPFEHRSFGDELARCQRYFEKSYNQGTAPGTGAGDFTGAYQSRDGTASSVVRYYPVGYKVTKRANPTVVIYNPETAASGSMRLDSNNESASVSSNGDANCMVFSNDSSIPSHFGAFFHYTLDAEL